MIISLTDIVQNVVGAFYLTHLLMPALLKAAQSSPDGTARVVGTSSSTAEMAVLDYASLLGPVANTKPVAAGVLYAQSKLGVAISARELARRYGDHGIVSMSAHPGEPTLTPRREKELTTSCARLGSISTGLFRNLPFPVRPIMVWLSCFSPRQFVLLTEIYHPANLHVRAGERGIDALILRGWRGS